MTSHDADDVPTRHGDADVPTQGSEQTPPEFWNARSTSTAASATRTQIDPPTVRGGHTPKIISGVVVAGVFVVGALTALAVNRSGASHATVSPTSSVTPAASRPFPSSTAAVSSPAAAASTAQNSPRELDATSTSTAVATQTAPPHAPAPPAAGAQPAPTTHSGQPTTQTTTVLPEPSRSETSSSASTETAAPFPPNATQVCQGGTLADPNARSTGDSSCPFVNDVVAAVRAHSATNPAATSYQTSVASTERQRRISDGLEVQGPQDPSGAIQMSCSKAERLWTCKPGTEYQMALTIWVQE